MTPRCQITVAHNGSKVFPLDKKMDLKGKQGINIGYLGSIYKGRGVELIIGIAKSLKEYNFHIAGGSKFEIEEIKKRYDLTENLYFYGYIEPFKSYIFRNSCDILLAPYSRNGVMIANGIEDSSKYMNPIKVIEYMSSGKPIIASDLVPIREIINYEQAVLVEPENVEEWINAIKMLAKDEKMRIDISRSAYSHFVENLTWRSRAEKLVS